MRTLNVLVVDDSTVNRLIVSRLVSALGHHVLTAEDGLQALACCETMTPDLILMDVIMPRMDGLEVLKHIRSDEKLKHLPVVILSSSREESDLARSWDLGVNAYVVKPVDIDQFFQAVKTLGTFWAVINETPVGD